MSTGCRQFVNLERKRCAVDHGCPVLLTSARRARMSSWRSLWWPLKEGWGSPLGLRGLGLVFEIIGLLIGIVLCFALSRLVGSLYGRGAQLILRSRGHDQKLRIIATYLPVAFAVYMLGCAVTFSAVVPGQSEMLFGGISERLPNGYLLMALGKMPEYGRIEAISTTTPKPALYGFFGSLEVDGPLVLGAYNWRSDIDGLPKGGPGGGDQGYFSFDTRSGKVVDFGTLVELNRFVGHSVRLVENQSFHSSEPTQSHLVNMELAICFGPPVVVTAL
jgi:hypothetical protein